MKKATNRLNWANGKGPKSSRRVAGRVAPLAAPDLHYASAAQGWIELGNLDEARSELEKISRAMRGHPDVLQLRCYMSFHSGEFSKALIICRSITHLAPERDFGWLYLAELLKELNRCEEGYEALFAVLHRFPKNAVMRYSMACLSCRLGRTNEALAWLRRAMKMGDSNQLMTAALNDPDLEKLWAANI